MLHNTNYPGSETEFFVMLDGAQKGPYRGLLEVFKLNIRPDTPVWHDGLAEWTPAFLDKLTGQLFSPQSGFYRVNPEALAIMQARASGLNPDADVREYSPEPPALPEPPVAEAFQESAPTYGARSSAGAAPQMPMPDIDKPKAYLAWSIVMTILCCLPTGIVAIVYSCKVNSAWYMGDVEKSRRASERAQLWIVLSFILGLIATIAMMFWSPFIGMLA